MPEFRDSEGDPVPAEVQRALERMHAHYERDWSDKRVAFFPDYCAESPLWVGGTMIPLDRFPLSEDLKGRLNTWSLAYLAQDTATPEEADEYEAEGRGLVTALRRELGPEWTVDDRFA